MRNVIVLIVFWWLFGRGRAAARWLTPVVEYSAWHPFGERTDPILGTPGFHNGIDFVVPSGTRVLAPTDGVIKNCFEDPTNGTAIQMETDDGHLVYLIHLSVFKTRAGLRVKRGDLIALSGATGRVTGPHLHVTIRHGKTNEPLDPKGFFDVVH